MEDKHDKKMNAVESTTTFTCRSCRHGKINP